MVRSGGRLCPVSWETAIEETVTRIEQLQARYGHDAMMFLSSAKMTNEENYAFMRLARGVYRTNNIDHCARL